MNLNTAMAVANVITKLTQITTFAEHVTNTVEDLNNDVSIALTLTTSFDNKDAVTSTLELPVNAKSTKEVLELLKTISEEQEKDYTKQITEL